MGSLSGGCVEEDLLEKLQGGEIASDKPQFFRYGESEEEAEQLGLPCGGHLDIVIDPLHPNSETKLTFARIYDRLKTRQLISRSLDVSNAHRSSVEVENFAPFDFDYDTSVLRQVHGPSQQLFIIGASMVSQYVAELGKTLEFQVTICDPRQSKLDELVLDGVELICDMPDDVIRERASDAQTAIVALTHDPRIDDMGLLQAFETDAFYIGAMGSDRTSAKRRERLIALEVDETSLNRLHAPIGLPIGSKTPPEIAISIIAEIIKERSRLARASHEVEKATTLAVAS